MAKTAPGGIVGVAESMFSLLAVALRHDEREISLTAASTLATLDRTGPRRISELAATEGIAQPSMTVLVTGLAQAGLVERRPDPSDGRAVLVSLTEEGRASRRRRRRAGAERLVRLIEKLPAGEQQALLAAGAALAHLSELGETGVVGG